MNAIINGVVVELTPAKPSLKDCPPIPAGQEADYVFVTNMPEGNYDTDRLDPTLCFIGPTSNGIVGYGVYYHKDRQGVNLKAECEALLERLRGLMEMA